MPLHGKIVVIKRGGGDGTAFPLTTACLFGRKPDCDIRIQLPQVSKEHCRIELNENKEVILTNLSSVNPTRINGVELQQSERLKHGDVITVIDRSFRFEYPPVPTPKKKRSSIVGKSETLQVLQDQQTQTPGENRTSEVSTGPCLKIGTNNDNIQRSLEKTMEVESRGDRSLQDSKADSPFNQLYQMIKQTLATPRKPPDYPPRTPISMKQTPMPGSVTKVVGQPAVSAELKGTPEKEDSKSQVVGERGVTPKSVKKSRVSDMSTHVAESTQLFQSPTQKFSSSQVGEQVTVENPKTLTRSRSREATPVKPATVEEQVDETKAANAQPASSPIQPARRTSPRSIEGKRKAEKRKRVSPVSPRLKRKRVSFGGHLSPELFDKRLPPDSPLCRGAAPRRSLCLSKPKQSLLRRASATGLVKEIDFATANKSSAKARSPRIKSPKAKTPSPKAKTPSPNAKTPSPKTPSTKAPKAKTPSTKAKNPPKAKTPSPKTPSPKAKTPSPKAPQTPSMPASSNKKRRLSVVATPNVISVTPTETPLSLDSQTATVNGRFSVSRINTPSPITEEAAVSPATATESFVTPKLRRKSMKSVSRKTPKGVFKNVTEVMRRTSGVSRASMKVFKSFADIVKFGQPKPQAAVAPAKKTEARRKMKKAAVAKPKTPAKNLKGHVTTGHANSPVTIVVGKAHRQQALQPAGAAPKLVHNNAVLKKNMKMDEDLTGIPEIFSTPVNTRKSIVKTTHTPVGALATSMTEMSVMNTPEEAGEMVVSPLSVVSTAKCGTFNNEAVQRLLQSEEDTSFVSEVPSTEMPTDTSSDAHDQDSKTKMATPKQKPAQPDCLTGVKRLLKTPKQKMAPLEDLRGKLLKTPKQKPQQPDCLSGVKRIMRTPKPLKVSGEADLDVIKELLKTPQQMEKCVSGDSEVIVAETPKVTLSPMAMPSKEKASPVKDNIDVVEETKTHRQEVEPMEDPVKTPKQSGEPLEENIFSQMENGPVDELMKEPATVSDDQTLTPDCPEDQHEIPADTELEMAKETQVNCEVEDGPSDVIEDVPQVDVATGIPEILSTPVNTRKSIVKTTHTPVGALTTSMTEMSVMNTPEEAGEMVVSPLSVVSTAKRGTFNNEAVQRLLQSEGDASFVSEVPSTEMPADASNDMHNQDSKTKMATPKQEPAQPDCLTGVKRIMRTPKLKGEPVEDLRGKLLKTPKPLKVSEEVDLDGVRELLKTPQQMEKSVSDVSEVLVTMAPKEKASLVGVKETKTQRPEVEPMEDLVKTPKQSDTACEEQADDIPCAKSAGGSPELSENVPQADMSIGQPEEDPCTQAEQVAAVAASPQENTEISHPEKQPEETPSSPANKDTSCPTLEPPTKPVRGKRVTKIKPVDDETRPSAPVRGRRGRELQTVVPQTAVLTAPRSRRVKQTEGNIDGTATNSEAPQEETSQKPRRGRPVPQAAVSPVEDYEGGDELMKEPVTVSDDQTLTPEDQHEMPADTELAVTTDTACEEQADDVPCAKSADGSPELSENVPQADMSIGQPEEDPCTQAEQMAAVAASPQENAEISHPEKQPEETPSSPANKDTSCPTLEPPTKPVRGKRVTKIKPVDDETRPSAPIRGRRGRELQTVVPQTAVLTAPRSRRVKQTEGNIDGTATNSEAPQEETSRKPRRGRPVPQAAVSPVEDYEGGDELMKEPVTVSDDQTLTPEDQHEMPADTGLAVTTDTACEEQADDIPCAKSADGSPELSENVPQAVMSIGQPEEDPCTQAEQVAAVAASPQENAEISHPEKQPEETPSSPANKDMSCPTLEPPTKPVRGKRVTKIKPVDDETRPSAPIRGRRGRELQTVVPQTAVLTAPRSRRVKQTEGNIDGTATNSEAPQEETSQKPRRGRPVPQAAVSPVEDYEGGDELMKEPVTVSDDQTLTPEDQHEMPADTELAVTTDTACEEQADDVPCAKSADGSPELSENVPQADMSIGQPEEDPCTQAEQMAAVAPSPQENAENSHPEKQPEETPSSPANKDTSCPTLEPPTKPVRGKRVTKIKPVDDETRPSAPVRGRRGREPQTVVPQTAVLTAPRSRRVKQTEGNIDGTATNSEAKTTRGRKRGQDLDETTAELPVELSSAASLPEAVEVVEQPNASPAEKPRRGRRPAKRDPEIEVPPTEALDKIAEKPKRGRRAKSVQPRDPEIEVPPTEALDKIAEKPKRGRRAKSVQPVEDMIAEVPQEVEPNQSKVPEENAEVASASALKQPDAPVVISTRVKRANAVVKDEVPPTAPVKRVRRGAAPVPQEAAIVEEIAPASRSGTRGKAGRQSRAENADVHVEVLGESVNKGRKKAVTPVPATPVEIICTQSTKENVETVDDTQMSKKYVNWKEDLTVIHEIPNPTPVVKATRGRKAKLPEQQDEASHKTSAKGGNESTEAAVEASGSKASALKTVAKRKVSRNGSKAEEVTLSEKPVSQPVIRARKGAAAVAASVKPNPIPEMASDRVVDKGRGRASKRATIVDQTVEVSQPKTRRTRAAKT